MGALIPVSQARRARRPARHALERRKSGRRAGSLYWQGVTFDTGGISIKPVRHGHEKWDMGGAGAVAGAIKAIAGRKAQANVVGRRPRREYARW